MPKAGSALTGGSGDVNPQIFRLAATGSQLITSGQQFGITVTQPVPINRLGQKGERVVVMELLKVRYHVELGIPYAATGAKMMVANSVIWLATAAPNGAAIALQPVGPQVSAFNQFPADPKVIDFIEYTNFLNFSSFSETLIHSGSSESQPIYHDLTDEAGHGLLVATDNMTLTGQFAIADLATGTIGNQPSTITSEAIAADVIYRFKEVTLKEYIGIVQSQQ